MTGSLEQIILEDDIEKLRSILEEDSSVANDEFDEPLRWAAGNNRWRSAELLLVYGAEVNFRDDDGRTALHYAAASSPEAVEVLLRYGANVNVEDKRGHSPLSWAFAEQIAEGRRVIDLLLRSGANHTIASAVAAGNLDLVRELLAGDPTIIRTFPSPVTLLSLATCVGGYGTIADRRVIVQLLLENGLRLDRNEILKSTESYEKSSIPKELTTVLREYLKKSQQQL